MKVLIVDTDGVGLNFAWRCVLAGHQVKWFVKPKPANHPEAGKGFKGVERIQNWVAAAKWADIIVPTSNDDYVPKLTQLKAQGFPVFGPTTQSAKLEIDRGAGLKLLEKYGIQSAPYETFPNMKAALKHVEKTGDRFVFKTLGDNEDKSLTYVSKHAADLVGWLRKRIDDTPLKGEVMLQAFVEGIEMGVSRFMGSKGFVGPFNESFEHKKMMPGNYGPQTGETGTVAYFTEDSKLGMETLQKLEGELMRMGHEGDVALGFMIDKEGIPRPTEWTCREGWPFFNLAICAVKGDPVQWMLDAHEGKDTTTFSTAIGTCVVVTTPPFPFADGEMDEITGNPIYGVTNGNRRHLHPQGVKIDVLPDMDGEKVVERPLWNTAGAYNLVVTGYGDTVKKSRERAFKTVKQLNISNMMVRDDIGEKMEETLPELHKHGYATHCEYE